MKRNIIPIYILLALGISSCSITGRLEKQQARLGLSQPNQSKGQDSTIITFAESVPKVITYTDKEGIKHTIQRQEIDSETGEQMTVNDLQEVTVTSRFKNVAERFGKVNLDFIVTVPSSLISNKWQLQLTPLLHKEEQKIELEKILLSGADFLKTQEKGYAMYQAFINSIIPDSAYLQHMFDENGYRNAMKNLNEEFYQSWKKDLLEEEEYIDWSQSVNKRYWLFNGIMSENKASVKENSILTTLPSYWMEREITANYTPNKFRNFLSGEYEITKKQITKQDSIEISNKYFDYKKIAENEKRKEQMDEKYKEYVRFPYAQARLDTIVKSGDSFDYYYTQEVDADDNIKKLQLTVDGLVLAKDGSTYDVPPSDTITYYISSMVQLIDQAPRYKKLIIARKADVHLQSLISCQTAKAEIDETLGNNESEIAKILDTYQKLTFSEELVLDSIIMVASASPEGSAKLNHELSKKRALSLKKYLSKKTDDKQGIDTLLNAQWIGEDWTSLTRMISANQNIEQKSEILELIGTVDNLDSREKRIASDYSKDYIYIKEVLYPSLRAVNFEFNLHRRGMIKDTIQTTVLDSTYMQGIELLGNKKYKDALPILSEYNDYNTAVCLMSLGYDPMAYEILKKEPDTANRNYLLSILCVRLKKETEAVSFFMQACEADASKIWRGSLDPEINTLMKTYNLYPNEN